MGGDAVAASAVGYPQAPSRSFAAGARATSGVRLGRMRDPSLLREAPARVVGGERDKLWLPAERIAAAAREKLGAPANGI